MLAVWHFIVHILGVDYGLPYGHWGWYNFHSGFAGSWEVGAVVAGVGLWWHHQCGVHGCYWYARRTTAAGERACWRHHPHKKRTAEEINAAHNAASGQPKLRRAK
jgi:hypothetical protein